MTKITIPEHAFKQLEDTFDLPGVEVLEPETDSGLWLTVDRVQQILDMPDTEDMPETLDELLKQQKVPDAQVSSGE